MKKIMIIDGDALGEPEHINAYNTYQVKNYDRFDLKNFLHVKAIWRIFRIFALELLTTKSKFKRKN